MEAEITAKSDEPAKRGSTSNFDWEARLLEVLGAFALLPSEPPLPFDPEENL